MKDGKIVNAVPAPTRASKYGINWDQHAEVARLTGQPVLAGTGVKESQAKAIRLYRRKPFIDPGHGRITVKFRNSKLVGGVRIGDVYFEWTPEQKEG